MKDSSSTSSGRFYTSRLSSVPSPVIDDGSHDEFEVLSTHTQLPAPASSVYSKKSPSATTASSIYSKKSPSISSRRSKASKSSKRSQMSATKDMRDDYAGRASRSVTSGEREEDEVLVSLPASMSNPSVNSKRSKAASTISQSWFDATPAIKSRTSNSTRSRKSMSSSSKSVKSNMGSAPVSASITNQDDMEQLSALSVQKAIAMLNGNANGSAAEPEALSVTASMATKRRQLKAKEIEMEEKWMALEEAERLNKQKEREINEKLAALRRQDEEEVVARMESLKALELQLNEKNRELKMKKEERDREINNKLEAIRIAEEERLKKEREIEEKAIDFAQKEQYINKRLALIEEASVARRRKERQVEERVFDFTQKEKEISNRLAAIEEASVARRRKEKEVEDKIMLLAQRETEVDKKLGSIETASAISRQKRHMEEREREMEMEEKLRLMELNKKEQLIREKNNALEEAMQLNIEREIEMMKKIFSLDAATNALLQKANAAQVSRDDSNDNTDSADLLRQNIETKKVDHQWIVNAFDGFTCSGSTSASNGYMPKDVEVSSGNISVGSEMSSSVPLKPSLKMPFATTSPSWNSASKIKSKKGKNKNKRGFANKLKSVRWKK